MVDKEDAEILLSHTWTITAHGYAIRSFTSEGKRKYTYLHREVLNFPTGLVDHINMDKLDNRKENLRVCTKAENARNSSKSKNNTSGYKGVYLNKRTNSWMAAIIVNRKQLHLGYFKNKLDAALAYNEAALIHHGEYARLNEVP